MNLTQEQHMITEMIMSMMGVHKMAYVKPISGEDCADDCRHYGVFASDGTKLAMFDSMKEALHSVRLNNLTPVNVH